jgi:hypothetical protein
MGENLPFNVDILSFSGESAAPDFNKKNGYSS